MSVTNVSRALTRYLRPVSVKLKGIDSIVKGKVIPTFATPVMVALAHFPLTPKDLKYLPEGVFNFQDRVFYEVAPGILSQGSIAIIGSDSYLIQQTSDRTFEGGFVEWIGKKQAYV